MPTTVGFTSAPYSQYESDGNFNAIVELDSSSADTVTVDYGGYAAPSGTLTFTPGQTQKTIPITVTDNSTAGSTVTQSFLMLLSNATNATLPGPTYLATVSILDDDSELAISNAQVTEETGSGTKNLEFTVTQTGFKNKTTTITYSTAADSGGSHPATATTDYTAATSATVVFAPNETTKTISVPIFKDAVDEYDQTFLVNLVAATTSKGNVTITDSQAIGTINDDDDPPIVQLSEARYSQDEGGDTGTTTATFTVILSEKSEKSATKVSYIARGCGCTSSVFGMILDYSDPREANKAPDPLDKNLALEGVDFIPASGFVTFAINDKDDQVVAITLIRDDFEEEPKDINLFLLSPVYASLTGIKTAKLSILDDDSEYTFDENDRLTEVEFSDETTKEWAYNVDDTIATSTDENGAVKTYTYDGYGFVRTTVDATNLTTTYVHSSQGLLLSKTVPDPDGAGPLTASTTTYTYDSGRLTQITHPDLSTHEYSYDSRNNLLTDRDELGHTTTYVYDSVNHRISQTDATGGTTTYTYDANGGLETITDPLNRVTTYVHDAHGWVIRQILPDPDGVGAATSPITTLTYNAAGQTLTTIDPLGRTTSMTYYSDGRLQTIERPDPDGAGPLTSAVTTFVYDSGARTETRIDPSGARTTSAYNARGWQTATTDPSGAITTQVYDATGRASASVAAGSLPTTTIYDAAGRAIATIDENGHRTTTIYDGRGHVQATVDPFGNRSTFIYDALDRQVATIDPYGHTSTAVYDAANHTIASIDVFGNRTTYVYDNAGRQIATVDPSNNRTTTVFDAAGHVIANIDAYGNRTTSVYDNAGRQIATINPDNQISTTVYDAANQVVETIDPYGQRTTFVYENGQRTLVIDPFGHRATTVYDAAGRTVESIDIYGHATTFLYDAADRQNATIDIFGHRSTTTYNAAGQVEATIDAFGQRVTYSYDSAGRTIATLDSLGNRATTVYDSYGRAEATIDPLNHRATTVFDSRGRVEATIDVLGNRTTTLYDTYGRAEATMDARGNRTTTVYDSQGRYQASIDALGNRTTSVYDSRGRAEATVDALGNRTTTVYDSRGRYEATIDALGNRTTVVYDSLGRTQANINALGNRTTTVYDSRGRYEATIDALTSRTTAVYDAYGRNSASINALGNRTTTLYDAYGRAEATINPLGNRTTTVYDAYNRQIATVDALTGRVTYAYDTHDRRTSVTDPVGNITTSVYDSLAREIQTIDPLNHSATFAYDALGRLESSTDRLFRSRTFSYDAVGNKIGETWSVYYGMMVEETLMFTYDAVGNQLTAANSAGIQTMTYDALGRVTHVDQLVGASQTFSYDSVGNRTVVVDSLGGIETSTFDAVGQLTKRSLTTPPPPHPFTFTGHFFADVDRDGIQDGGESDTEDVEVALFAAGSSMPLFTTSTDSNGEFSFADVPGDSTYYLTFTTPDSSFLLPADSGLHFVMADGTEAATNTVAESESWSIGLVEPASSAAGTVTGHFWEDLNGDGDQDYGEDDLEGVIVTIVRASSVVVFGPYMSGSAISLASTATDSSGDFSLEAPDGNYYLQFESPTSTLGFAANGTTNWAMPPGTKAFSPTCRGTTEWSFGLVSTIESSPLVGHIYQDANANGVQDGGESDVSVNIWAGSYPASYSGSSDSSGDFSLTVPQGSYSLTFGSVPTGWVPPPNQGFMRADSSTFYSPVYQGLVSLNIGLIPVSTTMPSSGTISGHLFDDANRNGTQDYGEGSLSGKSVTVLPKSTGGFADWGSAIYLTTDSGGDFSASAPSAGYFIVFSVSSSELIPANLQLANQNFHSANSGLSYGSKSWNLGIQPFFTADEVTGVMFKDANENGVQDEDEAPIVGAVVRMTVFGEYTDITTTTDEDGEFAFYAPTQEYSLTFITTDLDDCFAYNSTWLSGGTGTQGVTGTVMGASEWTVGLVPTSSVGAVTGQVLNYGAATGLGVVLLRTDTSSPLGTLLLDEEGRFAFPDPGGSYYIRLILPSELSSGTSSGMRWMDEDGSDSDTEIRQGASSFSIDLATYTAEPAILSAEFRYDTVGRLQSHARYTDLASENLVAWTTYTYDAVGRVTEIVTKDVEDASLANFQYTYDAQDRITVQNDNGTLSTYSYDTTDQLTGEDTTGTDGTYTYDANGNRTMSGYDTDADNRLASDGTWEYTYDAEGNMTGKDAIVGNVKWLYGYDHRNQLTRVDRKTNGTDIDLTVDYRYDAWGNRVAKYSDLDGPGMGNAEVTKFALDGWNPAKPSPIGTENVDVLADLADDGSLKTRYFRGDEIDQLIARIDAVGSHPGTYWHLTDHLGSIRKIIDNAGTVKDSLTYNAFGTITAETDSDYRGRYTFTGRELEVETGLQYNRARFYDPSIGRWISKDPLGFAAGDSNLYRYVNNAPTNFTDPSGLQDSPPNFGFEAGDYYFGIHYKQNKKSIGDNDTPYVFIDVEPLIKKGGVVQKSGSVAVGVIGTSDYVSKVTFAQFERVKVFEKKDNKWTQFNPGGISYPFPPGQKDSWSIPIDGSWIVDNKGTKDKFVNYPGNNTIYTDPKTKFGIAVMTDSPTTSKYIFQQLQKANLKDCPFFKVTADYLVLIYHSKQIIGYAEYSVTFDSDSKQTEVDGVGKVGVGNPPGGDFDAIEKFIKAHKLGVK